MCVISWSLFCTQTCNGRIVQNYILGFCIVMLHLDVLPFKTSMARFPYHNYWSCILLDIQTLLIVLGNVRYRCLHIWLLMYHGNAQCTLPGFRCTSLHKLSFSVWHLVESLWSARHGNIRWSNFIVVILLYIYFGISIYCTTILICVESVDWC